MRHLYISFEINGIENEIYFGYEIDDNMYHTVIYKYILLRTAHCS